MSFLGGALAILAIVNFAFAQSSRPRRPDTPLANMPEPRLVDEERARAAGIRKLTGKYLVLYTNVKSSPEVDRLPKVFDQAVPQWAEYFGVGADKLRNWQVQGFLISARNREPFEALDLVPAGNEEFPNGISVGREFWLYSQPSDYYQRHLMLHEGTHVFMLSFLGGCGPGWYMEGTAELFGTHRYDERYKQLTLRTMPTSRGEVPMWGRVKLIRTFSDQLEQPLAAVLEIDNRRQLGDSQYAWCWAATKFLDSHPRYRARFRKLQNNVTAPDFNDRFRQAYRSHWNEMQAEWQAYIATLDYGYDFERMAIDFRRGQPLTKPVQVAIAADRGWQSSGVRLEAGRTYRIAATGRYEIARDGEPWPCEPGGVTIDYHDGRPLGMLLGAIDSTKKGATLANPIDIGLGTTITPAASGTLYLRVNDSPAKLDDNRGTLTATISPAVR
ncbi:MAG: hypothetical protein L0228_15730 [Planctomycetes bacterium]|nr:hypothetical protein [Planctomycetota bacterium]